MIVFVNKVAQYCPRCSSPTNNPLQRNCANCRAPLILPLSANLNPRTSHLAKPVFQMSGATLTDQSPAFAEAPQAKPSKKEAKAAKKAASVAAPEEMAPAAFETVNPAIGSDHEYGSILRRFFALVLDSFIYMFLVLIATAVVALPTFFVMKDDLTTLDVPLPVLASLVFALVAVQAFLLVWYYILRVSKTGQTLGKSAFGLRIQTLDGNLPTKSQAFARLAVASFLSGFFLIGYIMAFFSDEKQTLHDRLAKTVVVKTND